MPGIKGRSGGARRGAGRYIVRAVLPHDAALSLKVLIKARGWDYSPENVNRYLAEIIERDWRDYDAKLTAIEPWEGGVL
jgi:hypothetical protein